jgi:hypothetical protein
VEVLQDRRIHILSIEEETWRLKRRSLWLSSGDKNTNFFHKYANFRRSINSIRDLFDDEGNEVSSLKELKKTAVNNFKFVFQDPKDEKLS